MSDQFHSGRGTALLALLAAFSASCVSYAPRPVSNHYERQAAARERIQLADDQEGQPILTVLAAGRATSSEDADEVSERAAEALTVDDVLESVELHFPAVLAALETIEIARAAETQALGGFDARFKAGAEAGVQGFYENETAKAFVEQPTTAWGATPFIGYKRGTGDFPIWEGGRKTNSDGEASLGVRLPLLRGRAIDARRLELAQSRLLRDAAEPMVIAKRIDAARKAAKMYWKWVGAGEKREIAKRLLQLAETRQAKVEISVDAGALAKIARKENRRLVVEREAILVQAERNLESAAISLSLFWRDARGGAVMPGPEQLPRALPAPSDPALTLRDNDVEFGLRSRPELRSIDIDLESIDLDRRKAVNDMLPKVDVSVAGSQDYGDAASNPDDKGPFEFDAWLTVELPIQRRTARGKRDALDAKGRKLQHERRLARDQITIEIEDARSAVRRSWQQLARFRENVTLAAELEQAERRMFDQGQSDLFRVNLREQRTASAASTLVDTITSHFQSLAEYRASLGVH